MGAFDDFSPVTIPESEEQRKRWGWEPHEQVVLKGSMDIADQEYTANQMGALKKDKSLEIRMGTGRFSLLDRMILSWTFTRNGKAVPLSQANIRKLPSRYSTPILEAIDRIVAPMSEEEQTDFLDSANGRIVESSGSESLSPMTL
jgi:hypothetical protein